jgi:hypothetical protein
MRCQASAASCRGCRTACQADAAIHPVKSYTQQAAPDACHSLALHPARMRASSYIAAPVGCQVTHVYWHAGPTFWGCECWNLSNVDMVATQRLRVQAIPALHQHGGWIRDISHIRHGFRRQSESLCLLAYLVPIGRFCCPFCNRALFRSLIAWRQHL